PGTGHPAGRPDCGQRRGGQEGAAVRGRPALRGRAVGDGPVLRVPVPPVRGRASSAPLLDRAAGTSARSGRGRERPRESGRCPSRAKYVSASIDRRIRCRIVSVVAYRPGRSTPSFSGGFGYGECIDGALAEERIAAG